MKRGWPSREKRRANLLKMIQAKPEWGADRILELQDQIEKLEARLSVAEGLLADLLDCGQWFPSALDIDTYNQPLDGKDFEQKISEFLGRG